MAPACPKGAIAVVLGTLLVLVQAPALAQPRLRHDIPRELRQRAIGCWVLPGDHRVHIRRAGREGLQAILRSPARWRSDVRFSPRDRSLSFQVPARNHGPVYIAFLVEPDRLRATSWTHWPEGPRAAQTFEMLRCPGESPGMP